MGQNEIVRNALNHRWLEKQGLPDMRVIWIALYYPEQAQGADGNPACAGSRTQGGVGLGSESLPRTRFGLFGLPWG